MPHIFTSLILNLYSLIGHHTISGHNITVKVENLRSTKGVLIVALFNSEDSYLKNDYKSLKISVDQISNGVTFNDIPEGMYAASIIHDENENGELDKNWMGIPKESFGFTKKTLGIMGPPSFKETCFELKEDISVIVKMKSF